MKKRRPFCPARVARTVQQSVHAAQQHGIQCMVTHPMQGANAYRRQRGLQLLAAYDRRRQLFGMQQFQRLPLERCGELGRFAQARPSGQRAEAGDRSAGRREEHGRRSAGESLSEVRNNVTVSLQRTLVWSMSVWATSSPASSFAW